jgi:5'-nucleotidase
MKRPAAALVLVLLVLSVVVAACSSGDDDSASPTSRATTTTAKPATLEILVTNDDGFDAPGIDAVVEALRKEPNVHVTVVAPATNQSGTGAATTPGKLAVQDVQTKSGYPAKSVAGHPADTVNVALDDLGLHPDLVVSGTNTGQNIGPFATISGTVGAATTAAKRGIPALAASTGLAPSPDYALSAKHLDEWLRQHRAALLAANPRATVENINTPTCPTGDRGVVDVTLAPDFQGRNAGAVDCASTKPASQLTDDVDAFLNGFTTLTPVPVS